ncbi:hypothetical protein KDL01_11380 [Actinospica durhamensis]|uniref:Uncharacterized protein n=1 Tax=Actinospica durhamensis TaxID=1508375 RepID=A0A941ENV6_9ACTN|nr:hypothetical protein [Actinospica durhamensis]MBR7833872.1 hypothetical protein [Actinospica durhamensis]
MPTSTDGPNPASRPGPTTAAGRLLIILGGAGLALWALIVLLGLAVASALNSPDAGGTGQPIRAWAYLVIALPAALCIMETVSGILVLRRVRWGLTTALVISSLAAAGGIIGVAAPLLGAGAIHESATDAALFSLYAGIHILTITLLVNDDTRRWYRPARPRSGAAGSN